MVCKEEVLTWFKDLDSYKRIDVLCELLNMCVPFELRFVGTIVEENGKHSYQQLRGHELFANDVEKLEKDLMFKNQNLYEEAVRHRVLLNISLLTSRNYSVANWYCKKFLRTDYIEELVVKEKDDMVQNELLLLFTMASRHPAFSFDQKEFFSRILVQLCELKESRLLSKPSTYGYPPGFGYPSITRKTYTMPDSSVPVNYGMQPPGHAQPDFMSPKNWPGIACGAPEVPPFPQPLQPPPPNVSPLVSQAGSPSQSRSTSPHRSPLIRPPPPAMPPTLPPPGAPLPPPGATIPPPGVTVPPPGVTVPPPGVTVPPPGVNLPPPGVPLPPPGAPLPSQGLDMLPMVAPPVSLPPPPLAGLQPPPIDTVSQSSQPSPVFAKTGDGRPEDELKEDLIKPQHTVPWLPHSCGEVKPVNGMRLQFTTSKIRPPCLADQMQVLTLGDIECSAYQSNSSSNSSPNQTPPGTPLSSNCPLPPLSVPSPHGPGRGPLEKTRSNGMGGGFCPPPPPPLCDTTSPPPAAFSGCTVPYSYQSFATLAPNRSLFHYNTATFHRPPTFAATAQFPAPPPSYADQTNAFPTTYSLPYFSLMYSSYPPAAQHHPPRNQPPPGCYNCGALGHVGPDCSQQNVDEITQKKTYQLDYSQVHDGGDKL